MNAYTGMVALVKSEHDLEEITPDSVFRQQCSFASATLNNSSKVPATTILKHVSERAKDGKSRLTSMIIYKIPLSRSTY